MNNKNFVSILGLILIVAILAFAYKYYSAHIQKTKELEVINSQRQKEESILNQKQDYKSQQQSLINDCIANADQELRRNFDLTVKKMREKYPHFLDPDYCSAMSSFSSQADCYKMINDIYQQQIDDRNKIETDCYKGLK